MTLSGTDISTFGLKLLKLSDYYNLPARKRILSEPAFGLNDIKYEPRRAVVKMYGKYSDQNTLATAVNGFRTLLETAVEHTVIIPGHVLGFTGVFPNGFKTKIQRNVVWIDLEMVIIES